MLSEAEGAPPAPPARRRWPLLAWVLPDTLLALAIMAGLAAPILLIAGLISRLQGTSLYTDGKLALSPGLFFALVLVQNLAFVAVVVLRIFYLAKLPPRWLGLVAPQPLRLIASGLGIGVGFLALNVVVGIVFTSLGIEQNQAAQYPLRAGDFAGQLLIATAGIILAPLVEELFFRGYIYGALRESLGVWAAIVVSAALFALAHLFSATEGLIALILPVFLLGIVLAYVRERSGSLLPGIVAHMVNNAIGMAALLYCVNVPGAAFCPR